MPKPGASSTGRPPGRSRRVGLLSETFPWIDSDRRGLANLIGPGVNDRIMVEVVEIGQDAAFECLSSSFNATRTWRKHRARHFGEEALDQIERASWRFGRHKGEASFRLCGHPGFGFLRDVRRVIVEDQPYGGVHRIGGTKLSEEGDELARTQLILHTGMDATRQQVDPASRVPWRLYSWSRAQRVARVPGCGGRSGAGLPMAWIPGLSS